jgi:predicted ATPase
MRWASSFALLEHYKIAISIYNPERHRSLVLQYLGLDAAVYSLTGNAITLWQLGYPDQALKKANEALALAHTLSHPFSLALAKSFAGVVHHFRREAPAAQGYSESAIALCSENGTMNFLDYSNILSGWTMVIRGRNEEGFEQIYKGRAPLRESGPELRKPYFLCLLVEACMETEQIDEGLSALEEALAAAEKNQDRNYEAEIHRLQGELLLRKDSSSTSEVQKCLERAIEVARTQGAKSLEVRATTSLARLRASQSHRDEARALLADIYGWFTEGFDTADLKDAKALLDELSG